MNARNRLPPNRVRRLQPVAPQRRQDLIWLLMVFLVSVSILTASFVLLPLAIAPPTKKTKYTLAVDSDPRGIHFTVDAISYTTPLVVHLEAGSHTLVVP